MACGGTKPFVDMRCPALLRPARYAASGACVDTSKGGEDEACILLSGTAAVHAARKG